MLVETVVKKNDCLKVSRIFIQSSLVYLPILGQNKIRQTTQGANNAGMTKFCGTTQGIKISKPKGISLFK